MQVLIWSASLYVLLNQLNGDNGALFLPKARRPFQMSPLTMLFAYQFHNSQKSYQGNDVSCLGITESHLVHNALLLQLSCYQPTFKSISQKQPITSLIVAEVDSLVTRSWLRTAHWDRSQLNPTCTCRISSLFTPRPRLHLSLEW